MLDKYMTEGFPNVEGWCSDQVAPMVQLIDAYQRQRGTRGGAAEIGIHHGKLFMLLNSVCDAGERSYAIDLFERQDLNIDHSGSGSRTIFEQNLQRYDRHKGANVSIISADSTTAPMVELIDQRVRLFSIDGGHTVEHTLNDIAIAAKCLSAEGVVILDDILSSHWLGVIEAAIRFLSGRPTLVPFAIGHNKLLMCNLSHYQNYFDIFAASALSTKVGVAFVGNQIVAM